MIQHIVFFEHLGETKETTQEWDAVSAGLLVLRLFDVWVEYGPRIVATDMTLAAAIRERVDLIDEENPVRGVLHSVLDAIYESEVVDLAAAGPRVMAYGKALDYTGQGKLAADVFQTVVAHVHPIENANLAIEANKSLARTYKLLGQWERAKEAYERARNIAQHSGDIFNVLWAFIGDATIATERGNLPMAEQILQDTIVRADAHGLDAIKRLAVHQRAFVAYKSGDLERAIRLGYEALKGENDPNMRDSLLANLATFFGDLGLRNAARDAHLLLAATAQLQVIRWQATLNLMEIAYLDDRQPVFEQYRKELVGVSLPANFTVEYYYCVGRGYEKFGNFDLARNSYQHAMTLASAMHFNQLLFDIEKALASLGKKELEQQKSKSYEEISSDISEIASAISKMRVLAGITTEMENPDSQC